MTNDFLRYSCQLALPGFTEATQQKLQDARVLIAGAGGLGCPAAQYLAAAGVGTLGIADYDTISIRNLHRQVLYTPAEVGLKKTVIACRKLKEQNPGISLVAHDIEITSHNVMELITSYDLVVDGTDNFETRYLLNDACVLNGKPLVYGAIYQYEGQVSVWNVQNQDGAYTPNYRDIFPDVHAAQVPNCAEGGVMPTLAGIIGCLQANEAIKFISDDPELLAGKMLMFDVRSMQSRIIHTGKVTRAHITHLTESSPIPLISAGDFAKDIENELYDLVDVRSREEHEAFNIGGTNIPVTEIEKNTDLLNQEKIIVLYCSTGKRSAEAVKIIRNRLPSLPVYSLEGGLQSWTGAKH